MEEFFDIALSNEPLLVSKCMNFVRDDRAGGNTIFVGTVREQTQGKSVLKLEFEAYKPMARKELLKIAESMFERWNALKISIHHRLGTLERGEIAVIIAVSTPHRKASFEACEYAIDTLKETVPIWKKEIFEDGAIWVAAHP